MHSRYIEIGEQEVRPLAISPPSDIVLDVVRAAEPASVEAARTRLQSVARSRSTDAAFTVANVRPSSTGSVERTHGGTPEAFVRFEAMVLQTFIGSMLPDKAESVYGGGVAGHMWQSMLAQQLGTVMAERGGIGIADRMLSDFYVEDERKVPLQGVSPDTPVLDDRKTLSDGLINEIERQIARSLAAEGSIISDTTER